MSKSTDKYKRKHKNQQINWQYYINQGRCLNRWVYFLMFHMKTTGQDTLPQKCPNIMVIHSVMNIGALNVTKGALIHGKSHQVSQRQLLTVNIVVVKTIVYLVSIISPTCPRCKTNHLSQNMFPVWRKVTLPNVDPSRGLPAKSNLLEEK